MTLRDAEYWAKRFRQLEEAEHDKSSQYIYENVEKQFTLAIKELEKEITAWIQRFAEDNALSMAEARKRLTTKELQEFKWTVEDYIKHGEENHISGEWTKQLRNASDRVHVTRLDSLKIQMQQHLEALYGNQVDMLDKHLQETYADSYYHTAYEVAKGQEVAVQMNRLDNARLASVVSKPWVRDGKTFSDRLWRDKDTLNTVLQEQLSQAVIRGEPLGNITKNVRDRMGVAISSAARLVSTESAFFATAAQQKCFSFLGVKEYEFVATLDDRTSEICQDMDGKHFKLTDMKPGTNAPPMHCNCRSCIAPYFDDAKDSARAARNLETSKTETVPADMTYPEWKQTYVDKASTGPKETEKRFAQPCKAEMLKTAKPGTGFIQDKNSYEYDGVVYEVDGKHVVLDYSKREREAAEIYKETFGGEIYMMPRVLDPQNISTPDYLINGDRFDLKTITGRSNKVVYNAVAKKKKQAENFILDLTECPLSESEINNQINLVFRSNHTQFINRIITLMGKSVLEVFKRAKKEEKKIKKNKNDS